MKLTIFTPTYNRSQLLNRLFNSLQNQTCFDFEWLVVDDGSTDDTQETIARFQSIARFPIRYFWKENGGKHTAYNVALTEAGGEWFVCVDSDDQLTNDAVFAIIRGMEQAQSNKGIVAYKIDFHGKRIGDELPYEAKDLYLYELGIKYHCSGDYLFALETNVAKEHPFPIFSGEKFVPESVVWDNLREDCRFAVVRKNLLICEYQEDGYSSSFGKLMQQNPSGFCVYFLQRIDLEEKLLQRIVCAGKYWCFRWICKRAELKYEGNHKGLVALSVLPGIIFRIYYKLFRGI